MIILGQLSLEDYRKLRLVVWLLVKQPELFNVSYSGYSIYGYSQVYADLLFGLFPEPLKLYANQPAMPGKYPDICLTCFTEYQETVGGRLRVSCPTCNSMTEPMLANRLWTLAKHLKLPQAVLDCQLAEILLEIKQKGISC